MVAYPSWKPAARRSSCSISRTPPSSMTSRSRRRAAGATVLAEPTRTPWNSLNARLEGPAGLQLTLFTELGP
jgi:hypothetical protein